MLHRFFKPLENVALPLYYKGMNRKERLKVALEYLDKVGLKDWANHLPNRSQVMPEFKDYLHLHFLVCIPVNY